MQHKRYMGATILIVIVYGIHLSKLPKVESFYFDSVKEVQ